MRFATRVLIAVFAALSSNTMPSQANSRRFTVRDSIEMTTFSNPAQIERSPKVCFSPDGSKFLVVTSRGEIATDEVHSELLVYDTASVRRYLFQSAARIQPQPRRLASIAATPRAYATRAYASLITELRWSSDSRWIYFLGQESGGARKLYRVAASGSSLRAISPRGIDVRQFSIDAQQEVVFLGGSIKDTGTAYPGLTGIPINPDARVVTGLSLQQILFPALDNGIRPRVDSLWIAHATGPARVIATDHQLGGPNIDSLSTRLLDLSPDGRYVICILPVERIPASWRNYDPMPVFEQRRIQSTDSAQTSVFNFNRVRAYFLIDVKTGRRTELIDAPHASSFGYQDKSMVAWPRHGDSVLLTNTFLPLSGDGSLDKHRQIPCAAVLINLNSKKDNCIVDSRDQYHGEASGPVAPLQLVDAHFDGGDPNSVFLEFGYNTEDVSVEEHYVRRSDGWRRTDMRGRVDVQTPLSVYINQDLNTPPTLWAKAVQSFRAKELLNANPELKQMQFGQVSLYRWADETGRKWEGGLVLPPGYIRSKRYPLVIQTHGFQPYQFLVDGRFPTAMAAQPLAGAGMVVLQMGYTYDHVLTTQELDDQLVGYRSAIDHLVRDGIVDRKRVGIIGFSRPAWHVAAALVKAPQLFAAATLADGVDAGYLQYMIFGEGNLGLSGEFERINGGTPFGSGMERWLDRVVTFHLNKVTTPVRIEAIGPVSLLSEWEDYSSLRQQGKPVDLVYIPNGQHILQGPLDRLASQEGNVAWFCFWLLDNPASAGCPTVPQAQMERWKEMRSAVNSTNTAQIHGGTR